MVLASVGRKIVELELFENIQTGYNFCGIRLFLHGYKEPDPHTEGHETRRRGRRSGE
jgi:hypothetical protein